MGPRAAISNDRAVAIAASAAAHLAFFALIVWRLGATPHQAEPPVLNVQLVPHLRPPADAPKRRRAEMAAPRPARLPPSSEPLPIAPLVTAGPADRSAEVRQALRGLVGCSHAALARLSAEEQARCREREVAALTVDGNAPPPRLNLDRRGEYAGDPEPYLSRRPKKGCKPRAAGDVSVFGQEGVAAGVSCAIPF
jgi:hypothetical protein